MIATIPTSNMTRQLTQPAQADDLFFCCAARISRARRSVDVRCQAS